MDTRDLGGHIFHRYDEALESLRGKILQIGGLVETQLASALRALEEGDGDLAGQVIADDHKVNELELAIDEQCVAVLARHHPVASDLRMVMSAAKAVTDLERMGDEAVRIARMALRSSREGAPPRERVEVRRLGEQVRRMLHDALDAFARMDEDTALRVVERDREVDREYESIVRGLVTFMMEDPRSIPRSLEVMFSARALERIGDRACNICENVVFLVSGRDVRHGGIDRLRDEGGGE